MPDIAKPTTVARVGGEEGDARALWTPSPAESIDTGRLAFGLSAIQEKVPEIADNYHREVGFVGGPKSSVWTLAGFCQATWQKFEEQDCQVLDDSKEELGRAMDEWLTWTARQQEGFQEELKVFNGRLKDDIRYALTERAVAQRLAEGRSVPPSMMRQIQAAGEESGGDNATEMNGHAPENRNHTATDAQLRPPSLAETKLGQVQQELEDFATSRTGRPDGEIEAENMVQAFWVGIVFACTYLLGEVLAGAGFFRIGGTALTATGLTVLLILMVFAATVMAARKLKLITKVRDARKQAEEYFLASGGFTRFGMPYWIKPVDRADRNVAIAALTITLVGAISLTLWRLSLAATDELAKGTGVAGVLMGAAILVTLVVVYYIAPSHVKPDVEKFIRLKHARDIYQTEVDAEQRNAEETSRLAEEAGMAADGEPEVGGSDEGGEFATDELPLDLLARAEFLYFQRVAKGKKDVESQDQEIQEKKLKCLRLLREYREARSNVLVPMYRNRVKELIDLLGTRLNNRQEYFTQNGIKVLRQILLEACPLQLEDKEFVAQATAFNPKTNLDFELVVREFQPLIDAAQDVIDKLLDEWDLERSERYNTSVMPQFGEEEENV